MTERYVVSDERLAEIRAMVRVDDIDVVPDASAADLASAVYDLLVERDDASAERDARLARKIYVPGDDVAPSPLPKGS